MDTQTKDTLSLSNSLTSETMQADQQGTPAYIPPQGLSHDQYWFMDVADERWLVVNDGDWDAQYSYIYKAPSSDAEDLNGQSEWTYEGYTNMRIWDIAVSNDIVFFTGINAAHGKTFVSAFDAITGTMLPVSLDGSAEQSEFLLEFPNERPNISLSVVEGSSSGEHVIALASTYNKSDVTFTSLTVTIDRDPQSSNSAEVISNPASDLNSVILDTMPSNIGQPIIYFFEHQGEGLDHLVLYRKWSGDFDFREQVYICDPSTGQIVEVSTGISDGSPIIGETPTQILPLGDGSTFAVVWYSNQHGTSLPEEIFVKVFDKNLQPVTDQIKLSDNIADGGLNGHLFELEDGSFLFTWYNSNETAMTYMAQHFDAEFNAIDEAFLLTDEVRNNLSRSANSKGFLLQSEDEANLSYWEFGEDGYIYSTSLADFSFHKVGSSDNIVVTDEDIFFSYELIDSSEVVDKPTWLALSETTGYISSEGILFTPGLERVADNTGSTDLYWNDYNGQSYLVSEQNVGAFSHAVLDNGNMVFAYAVHLGDEWHLNYRIYDPSSKSFVSEPVEVGTNIVATVMSGDQPSIQIQTNGSNFSLSLLESLNRDEELLKYAEVVEESGVYTSSEGILFTPGLERVADNTGSTDLYWNDYNGQSYLVSEQNVGAFSHAVLDNGNMVFAYAVHLGDEWHLNYRIYDPSSKSFVSEPVEVGTNIVATVMSGDQPSIQIQTNGSNFSLSLLESLNRDEELLKYAEVVEESGVYTSSEGILFTPGLERVADNTGSTDLYWNDYNGQSYLVSEQNVGAFSHAVLDNGNMVFAYAVHLGDEWHLNYRIYDPSSKSFVSEPVEVGTNIVATVMSGDQPSIQIQTNGSNFSLSLLESLNRDEELLKYAEVVEGPINILSGTPSNDDVGDHTVTLEISDGDGGTSEETISITVNNVNDEPLFDPVPNLVIYQGDDFSYQLTALDVDLGDELTFEAVELPSWLTLSPAGLLSGVADRDELGLHTSHIQVTDLSGATDQAIFSVEVAPVNTSILGNSSDYFIGDDTADHVETGGGNDTILSGAGDDRIIVQSGYETQTHYLNVTVEPTFDGKKYFIDGVQHPSINFVEGHTYIFDVSDPSNADHPLQLSEHSDGRHNESYYDHWYGDLGLIYQINGTPGQNKARLLSSPYLRTTRSITQNYFIPVRTIH